MEKNVTPEKQESLLSASDISRIKAEELLRKQIKDEITPKANENKFLSFLNSPLGLLLVSGLIIGGIGKLVTEGIDDIKNNHQIKKDGVKYVTELDERICQLNFFLKKVDTSKTNDSKKYFSTGVLGAKLGSSGWYNPIFSEFKEVPIQALIYWLKLNIDNDDSAENALKAIQAMIVNDSGICDSRQVNDCIAKLTLFKNECSKKLEKK